MQYQQEMTHTVNFAKICSFLSRYMHICGERERQTERELANNDNDLSPYLHIIVKYLFIM